MNIFDNLKNLISLQLNSYQSQIILYDELILRELSFTRVTHFTQFSLTHLPSL